MQCICGVYAVCVHHLHADWSVQAVCSAHAVCYVLSGPPAHRLGSCVLHAHHAHCTLQAHRLGSVVREAL